MSEKASAHLIRWAMGGVLYGLLYPSRRAGPGLSPHEPGNGAGPLKPAPDVKSRPRSLRRLRGRLFPLFGDQPTTTRRTLPPSSGDLS